MVQVRAKGVTRGGPKGNGDEALPQELEDGHVVLAESLAGLAGTNQFRNESGPLLGPLLLQDLWTMGEG